MKDFHYTNAYHNIHCPQTRRDFRTNYHFDYWYYLSLTPWGSSQKVYEYMRNVFLPKDVIAKDVIENMDYYFRRYSTKKILHILWNFTLLLYIKIYKMYVNCGKMIMKKCREIQIQKEIYKYYIRYFQIQGQVLFCVIHNVIFSEIIPLLHLGYYQRLFLRIVHQHVQSHPLWDYSALPRHTSTPQCCFRFRWYSSILPAFPARNFRVFSSIWRISVAQYYIPFLSSLSRWNTLTIPYSFRLTLNPSVGMICFSIVRFLRCVRKCHPSLGMIFRLSTLPCQLSNITPLGLNCRFYASFNILV